MDIFYILRCLLPHNGIRNHFQFLSNHLFALLFRIFLGVILQIFLERHQRIRLAAVDDLAGFQ